MNIPISTEEFNYINQFVLGKAVIGSKLYGTDNENSDTDYLCLYASGRLELESGLPNTHQFFYKDKEAKMLNSTNIKNFKYEND